jgi:hypothetical protein
MQWYLDALHGGKILKDVAMALDTSAQLSSRKLAPDNLGNGESKGSIELNPKGAHDSIL